MQFFYFQLIGTALLLGIQWYVYSGIRGYLGRKPRFRLLLLILSLSFFLFNLPMAAAPLLRVAGFRAPLWVTIDLMPLIYLWHFVWTVLFLMLVMGKFLKIPFFTVEWVMKRFDRTRPAVESFRNHPKFQKFDMRRRQLVRRGLTVVTGAIAFGAVSEFYGKETFDKTDIDIPIKNLPESFDGYSIGFLSDIHSGSFMSEERMRRYAESLNGLGAEMIVITGDFVNSSLDEVYPFRDAFRILSATDGVYGVLGNHDYYTRRVGDVAREIENAGIQLLRNDSVTIGRRGDEIKLVGVEDTGSYDTAMGYFNATTDHGRRGLARILLCHRPYFFKGAAQTGYGLVLSGHTHGGQVVLGELGKDVLAPARIASPYVAGLYTHRDSRMYVSRGIGTVGVPFRFNCPPEITRIVLRREV